MTAKLLRRRLLSASAAATWLALFCSLAQSQTTKRSLNPSPSDYAAANEVTNLRHHAWRANTSAARATAHSDLQPTSAASASASAVAAPDSGGPRYPADLQYLGGPVVVSMVNHAIFLHPNGGCTIAGCWGNPLGFLRDYGKSNMIHLVDQYVESTANNRYTVAEKSANINYTPPAKPFTDADMLAIIHAVVLSSAEEEEEDHHFATGYGNEYHVFLPPGQDECFDTTYSACYSPDNPSTFFFCAYHGSMDFSDIGHVLYSVEPYQNVDGCSVRPGTPNGSLIDSTNNVLSHELTETITDPDPPAGWVNIFNNGLFTEEIGDECSFLAFNASLMIIGFDPSNVTLNGKPYAIQPEYNNADHACTTTP